MTNLFSGSYNPEDVIFLLNRINIKPVSVTEKEGLIQGGKKHYSQMIGHEKEPTGRHWDNFNHAMALYSHRMAKEVQLLGNALLQKLDKSKPIILISLVRAGVPLGVLLKRHVSQFNSCEHYGVSIVRDRGIDYAALQYILDKHPDSHENIVFVDGWTGKGAIGRELAKSLVRYPRLIDFDFGLPRLVTLSDMAGVAWLSIGAEDWLIPSGILGSVVSGGISRSIYLEDLDHQYQVENCQNSSIWHGCIEYSDLKDADISPQFVDQIYDLMLKNPISEACSWHDDQRKKQSEDCLKIIKRIQQKYSIDDINRIKPSIAEATRAVLRRVPDRILLNKAADENTALLRHFAQEFNVPIDVLGDGIGQYQAITIIKKTS